MLDVILALVPAACFVPMCIALSVAIRLSERCVRLEAELEKRDYRIAKRSEARGGRESCVDRRPDISLPGPRYTKEE